MNAKSGVRGSSCKRSGTCADGGAPPTVAAAPGKMLRLTAETTNAFMERGYVSLRCTSIMAGRNFQKSLSQVAKLSTLWEDVGHLPTLNIPAPGKFQC